MDENTFLSPHVMVRDLLDALCSFRLPGLPYYRAEKRLILWGVSLLRHLECFPLASQQEAICHLEDAAHLGPQESIPIIQQDLVRMAHLDALRYSGAHAALLFRALIGRCYHAVLRGILWDDCQSHAHGAGIDHEIQKHLLREMIGNPFARVDLPDEVRTSSEVRSLALAANKERLPSRYLDQTRLFILADACEEAGVSQDNPLLIHLRNTANYLHPAGCWAVDVLLGRFTP